MVPLSIYLWNNLGLGRDARYVAVRDMGRKGSLTSMFEGYRIMFVE